ncbi:olfactory receptor 6N2-like [Erpetoichthys calabaricus]|uniref:olfactory receptor 6N2-like n=1 Tax=Erpetoichthys calabaricus TaxID=27687 RepID=UPI00109EF48D|nr:olfactory receptor 6N2-like [Erpetoichthys calabaricus]
MTQSNVSITTIKEFIIGGIPGLESYEKELFSFFLIVYIVTLLGNLLVFALIVLDHKLHTPMYFFIANLALVDLLTTTTISPKMLAVLVVHDNVISYPACFLQMYLFLSSECTVCFLLAVMAFDRYVAICHPLHYNSIITRNACVLSAAAAWVCGFSCPIISIYQSIQLPFCGPNKIHYCFCDFHPVLILACVDTSHEIHLGLTLALIIIYVPLILVVFSYIKILIAIFRIASSDGRRKAFSTCSSHLLVVLTFYVASAFVYVILLTNVVSPQSRMLVSLLYCVFTPMVNPLIYSFRNKDIKRAVRKLICSTKVPPA